MSRNDRHQHPLSVDRARWPRDTGLALRRPCRMVRSRPVVARSLLGRIQRLASPTNARRAAGLERLNCGGNSMAPGVLRSAQPSNRPPQGRSGPRRGHAIPRALRRTRRDCQPDIGRRDSSLSRERGRFCRRSLVRGRSERRRSVAWVCCRAMSSRQGLILVMSFTVRHVVFRARASSPRSIMPARSSLQVAAIRSTSASCNGPRLQTQSYPIRDE